MPNILNIPNSGTIFFSTETAGASTTPSLTGQAVSLAHDGQAGLVVTSLNTGISATNRFRVNGANGALFAVTDQITGTVFSVNDPAGLPIISADTGLNDVITMGTFGSNALVVRNDRVGVGTNNPNTSTALEIVSTTRGFRPPVMTVAQRNAIASPASGLVIYTSDAFDLSLYNGTAWGDVLTTHSASFTADTLRTACSQTQGTGSLVFATAPTIANGNFTYDDAAAAAHRTSLSLDRHYIQQGVNQQSSTIVYDFDNSYMPALLGLTRTILSGGSAQIANVGGTHWTSKVKGWMRIANPTANDGATEVAFGDATVPYQSGTGAPTAHNNYTLVYVFCCPNLTNVDIRLGLRTGNVARIIQLFQDNVASPGSSPVFNFFTYNNLYTNTATATGAIAGAPTPAVGSYTAGTGTRYAFVFDTYQRAGGTDTTVTLKLYSGNVTGDLSLVGTYSLANWNPVSSPATPYVSVRTINNTAAASSFLHLDTVIFKSWNNTSNILPAEILDIIKTP